MGLPTDNSLHVHPHTFSAGVKNRADLPGQNPGSVWFTSFPAAGKSTLADALQVVSIPPTRNRRPLRSHRYHSMHR